MTTLEIQRRLKALGHQPGPLDGVRGRLTIRAVRAFQEEQGLVVDGIVGRETLAKLFPPLPASGLRRTPPSPPGGEGSPIPWLEEALRLKGVREEAGEGDNPTILRWAKRLGLFYSHDATAWCGLFAAHCIGASLPDEPLPINPLGARNWLAFGRETKPRPGAVLVFWRGRKSGWQGHVGFHAGEDAGSFHVLGGNQSDAVTVARIARTRLLGVRWPRTAPTNAAGAIASAVVEGEALSTNEA